MCFIIGTTALFPYDHGIGSSIQQLFHSASWLTHWHMDTIGDTFKCISPKDNIQYILIYMLNDRPPCLNIEYKSLRSFIIANYGTTRNYAVAEAI